MKQLLIAMLMSVLVSAPIIGQSAPSEGVMVAKGPSGGGFSKGSSRAGKGNRGNPGRAAPRRASPGRSGVSHRRPGVGAPGPGVRPGPVHRPRPHRRPHGHHYHGYGYWHDDDDAWKFLAFTAITLKILDNANEQAQREHEAAQVKATVAPVGEKIVWKTTDASGYVVTTREGVGSSGLQCREFQQEITVGGKKEEAYGTACLQADGSWKITE